jgi:TolB-like protein/Flp pilus assembly protein TadD
MNERRKLTAIMFTDIVGYTALMAQDEVKALKILQLNREAVSTGISAHKGIFIKEIGDGTLSRFDSTLDAVNCAMSIQNKLQQQTAFELRIGIHVGDVIEQDNDIFGDGVNVAARLEQQAPVGGVCISETVYDAIRSHPDIKVKALGAKRLKGTGRDINIYNLEAESFRFINFDNEHLIPKEHDQTDVANQTLLNNQHQGHLKSKSERRIYVALTLLTTFLGLLYFNTFDKSNPHTNNKVKTNELNQSTPPSIAVLPFKDFSQDKKLEYLSLGLTEEILNVLANIKELRVSARTSSFAFKNDTLDIREIGNKLNVNYILEGSIRKYKNKIRVTAQLINTKTNFHLMSDNFDYELKDIFKFQDDISNRIVRKLSIVLSEKSKLLFEVEKNAVPEAYNNYLLAISHLNLDNTRTSIQRAIDSFEVAISISPKYAKAYAGLCQSYLEANDYYSSSSDNLIKKAETACTKARSLNPQLIEVYISLGNLYRVKKDFKSAINILNIALTKNPNSINALIEIGKTYRESQDLENAEVFLNQAIQLEPNNWLAFNQLGLANLFLGDHSKAEAAFKKILHIDPHNTSGLNNLGTLYLFQAKFERAASYFQRAMKIDPSTVNYSNHATVLHYLGHYQEAIELYKKILFDNEKNHFIWGNMGDSYVQLKKKPEAELSYKRAIIEAEKELLLTPKDETTINMLAYYYARVGNHEKAKTFRRNSITHTTNDMYIHYYASLTSLIVGDIDGALEDINNALENGYNKKFMAIAPEFAALHNNQEFIRMINE